MKKYPPHISLKHPNGRLKTEKELDAEAALPTPKKYWDIKLEVMLPATISYRVFAETPEKAIEMLVNATPNGVKHFLTKKKNIKAVVYDAGTTLIKLTKKYLA